MLLFTPHRVWPPLSGMAYSGARPRAEVKALAATSFVRCEFLGTRRVAQAVCAQRAFPPVDPLTPVDIEGRGTSSQSADDDGIIGSGAWIREHGAAHVGGLVPATR